MNLFSIASGVTSAVLPFAEITVQVSDGYTVNPDGSVTPKTIPVTVQGKVHASTSSDLQRVENISQQANMRTVFLPGNIPGIDRAHQWGGDLLEFDCDTWLVTQQLEAWPGWCRLLVTKQLPPPSP